MGQIAGFFENDNVNLGTCWLVERLSASQEIFGCLQVVGWLLD
jgi:hypothetical protein